MFKLDEFLRVYDEVTLPNGEVVTCRVLSDIEQSDKGAYALSRSVEMMTDLRNEDSESHRLRIAALKHAPSPQLIDTLIQAKMGELGREAAMKHPIRFFPYPEDATEQEKREAEVKQRNHEEEVRMERIKYVSDRVKSLRDHYESIDRELLVKTAMEVAIGLYSDSASMDALKWYTIWRSYEKDGKPYWESPGSVGKMGDRMVDGLYSRYMEVDSQDPWELTKSVSKGLSQGMGKNGKRRRKRKPAGA
jgi:hypothetical protein